MHIYRRDSFGLENTRVLNDIYTHIRNVQSQNTSKTFYYSGLPPEDSHWMKQAVVL